MSDSIRIKIAVLSTCRLKKSEWDHMSVYRRNDTVMIGKYLICSLLWIACVFLLTWNNTTNAYNTFTDCQAQATAAAADWSNEPWVIRLNTNVPFVGRCIIKKVDGQDANLSTWVPKLLQALIRITMTVVVVAWFLGILVWGFMITWAGAFGTAEQGKKIILGVIVWLILLWASWIILSLVNPDFFTLWS